MKSKRKSSSGAGRYFKRRRDRKGYQGLRGHTRALSLPGSPVRHSFATPKGRNSGIDKETGRALAGSGFRKRGYKPQFGSFTQKCEATAWARQLESEMDRGIFMSRQQAERTTLGELFDRYEKEITPGKASARREKQRLRQLRKTWATLGECP